MTKPKPYKRYSAEFKKEAIRRASEEGIKNSECSGRRCPFVVGRRLSHRTAGFHQKAVLELRKNLIRVLHSPSGLFGSERG